MQGQASRLDRASRLGRTPRRGLALPALLALVLAGSAVAGELRIVAPSAPGTGWDAIAQTLKLALTSGRPEPEVRIRNAPGGGGTLGLSQFLLEADGDDLLVTGLAMVDAAIVNRAPTPLGRLTPIGRLCSEPFALAVPASSTLRNAAELKASLLADPARMAWGGGPAGGLDHVAAILLARAVGLDPAKLRYVPFLTSADAAAALAEGRISAAILLEGEFVTETKAGRVRVLAQSSESRLSEDAPATLVESGIPLEFANWRGLVAKPGLDPSRRAELADRVARALGSAAWRDMLDKRAWRSAYLPPEPFGAFIEAEHARLKEALKIAGFPRMTE